MSTGSVSSPKKRGTRGNPAKWDDEKTKILLEVFEEEIDIGNRPTGIFSKQGWINIVDKLKLRTDLSYNKEQLKNRMDNLRREFTKWESLIGKETGLGWDNVKRTLVAPDTWWIEKAKGDPSILKYRESGPLHLDLLQKVFGGTTATGANLYIPDSEDPLLSDGAQLDFIDEVGEETDVEEAGAVLPETQVSQSASKLRNRKRKRDSTGKRLNQADIFQQTVNSITSTMNESANKIQRARFEEDALTYTDSLELLMGLPGMSFSNPLYWKGVRVLEERVRRIAFGYAIRGGVDAVCAWLGTFPDKCD